MGVRYEVIQNLDKALELAEAGLAQCRFRFSGGGWVATQSMPGVWRLPRATPRRKGDGPGRCWRLHGVYYQFRLVLEE